MIRIDKSLIPAGNFYIAVSGGVDSIACAHLLHRFYKERVVVCHYNHNLRPRNNVMQKAVEWFCEDFDIPFVSDKRTKSEVSGSVEDCLRKSRMEFFTSLRHDIVLCHHLDDAVESRIMRFLVGESDNYIPIPRQTKISNHSLVRPFMSSRKEDMISYVKKNDLEKYVVEDETNQENNYRRNWVRNVLLPQLQPFGLPTLVKKKFYSNEKER